MTCYRCGSDNVVMNGKTQSGEQRYRCKDCGKSFHTSEITLSNSKNEKKTQKSGITSSTSNASPTSKASHTYASAPAKEPWYRQDGVIALLTIFFFPLGLALIWASPKYQKKTKILWTVVVAGVVFLTFTGWFGVGLILTSALWFWVYKKHPALSAADAPSGKFCAYCGAQLPNSGVCTYCGGRSNDGE